VRYIGVSLGYQVGAAIVGAPAPLIAAALLLGFGGKLLPIGLFIGDCAVVSLVAMAFAKDRWGDRSTGWGPACRAWTAMATAIGKAPFRCPPLSVAAGILNTSCRSNRRNANRMVEDGSARFPAIPARSTNAQVVSRSARIRHPVGRRWKKAGRSLPQTSTLWQGTGPLVATFLNARSRKDGNLALSSGSQRICAKNSRKRKGSRRAICNIYMRAFAEAWPQESMVQAPLAQLPWYHQTALIEKLPGAEARLWYAAAALDEGWSRNILVHQIETRLHERSGRAVSNFPMTLPPEDSDLARQITKDP
jgi:hypothetical protein